MTPIETIQAFVGNWNSGDMEEMYAMCTDDVMWLNMPMDPIEGKAAMREGVAGFMAAVESCDWTIHSIAANGRTVLTERTDAFILTGGHRAAIRVMGTFELNEDGQITHWRDYFDIGEFQREFAGGSD